MISYFFLFALLLQLQLFKDSAGFNRFGSFLPVQRNYRAIDTISLNAEPKKAASFALTKGFLSDLMDLILNALPSILTPLKEVDYDKVEPFKPVEKGQTLKEYKKTHKTGRSEWDHEIAAKEFVQQYLHEMESPEAKIEKSSILLLRLIQDLERLNVLDTLNSEVQVRIKNDSELKKRLNQYALPSTNNSPNNDWLDLRQLKEELVRQGKQ